MDRSAPVMAAEHLEKRIAGKVVLRDVSFDIDGAGLLAVIGPNGSGKTTLLRVLSGILKPDGGRYFRFGDEVQGEARTDRRVGYLAHQSFLYPNLSVRDNLLFYARLWNVEEPRIVVDRLVKRVGLAWFQHDPVYRFSRGMVQRAAIARLLIGGPKLLLLDEPYTGLDLSGQMLLTEILTEFLESGGAAILITHQVEEALRLSSAVAILLQGRIVWWDNTGNWDYRQLTRHYHQWLTRGGVRDT